MPLKTLLVGAGRGGTALLYVLEGDPEIRLVGVVDKNPRAHGLEVARAMGLPIAHSVRVFLDEGPLDLIIDATGDPDLPLQLREVAGKAVSVMSGGASKFLWDLLGTSERLARSEERYRQLLEDVSDPLLLNRNQRIDYVNPAFTKTFGYSLEEIVGRHYTCIFTPSSLEQVTSYHQHRIAGQPAPEHYEADLVRKDGAILNCLVHARVTTAGGVQTVVVLLTDLTERKKIEREREEFFRFMVHELRAPLSPIVMGLSLLLRQDSQLERKARRKLMQVAYRGVARLQEFVDGFLDLARLQQQTLTVEWEEFPLRPVVQGVVEEQSLLALDKELSILNEVPEDLSVRCDRRIIRTVVQNYVNNAIKYTDSGTIAIRAEAADPGWTRFCVRDTGSGFDPSERDRLFGEFGRLKRHEGVKGTGLGLALVKLLVSAYGGKVGAENEGKGKGSTFWATLPLATKTETPAASGSAAGQAGRGSAMDPPHLGPGRESVLLARPPEGHTQTTVQERRARDGVDLSRRGSSMPVALSARRGYPCLVESEGPARGEATLHGAERSVLVLDLPRGLALPIGRHERRARGLGMCGIGGIVDFGGSRLDPDVLKKVLHAMTHRGPDDRDIRSWEDPTVGLVHSRLRILDLSALGRQPMSNEDGSLWVVFNGEIYNFADWVPTLQARGHVFRSRSDMEVILHLYEEFGEACLRHLNGMFAFALWDRRRQILFLARDRLGVKPLPYSHQPGRLEERIGALRDSIADATRIRLRSDVLPGAFLSGGIDSSIVVGDMAPFLTTPVKTCCVGYADDPYFDERRYARVVADRFGADHGEVVLAHGDVRSAVPRVLSSFDAPSADSSALPTFVVSQVARRFVTVALSGDGGDDVFGGYRRYLALLHAETFPALPEPMRRLARMAIRWLPDSEGSPALDWIRGLKIFLGGPRGTRRRTVEARPRLPRSLPGLRPAARSARRWHLPRRGDRRHIPAASHKPIGLHP